VVIDARSVTRVLDVSPTGSGINVTVTGVTIQHGYATSGYGGGIQVTGTSTLTLNNDDIVQNNSAVIGGGIVSGGPVTLNATTVRNNTATGAGGGFAGASIIVDNHSVISGNTADFSGGGIYVSGNTTVINSTVSGNETTSQSDLTVGGGIVELHGNLTIVNSRISSNSSSSPSPGAGGGGVYLGGGSIATIQGSVIYGNSSATSGGGLFLDYSRFVSIVDSEIDGNGAVFGGGLFSQGKSGDQQLTISSCTFFDNGATLDGGGLYLLSYATSSEDAPSASLTNVTITGNSAAAGGGLFTQAIYPVTLLNDTIAFNSATGTAGGVLSTAAAVTFVNTIVAKNTAGAGGDPDVDGAVGLMVDGGNNFIGDNTGAADVFAAGTPNAKGSFVGTGGAPLDPLLGGPADNGGAAALSDGSHQLTLEDQANNGSNGVRDRGNDAARASTSAASSGRSAPTAISAPSSSRTPTWPLASPDSPAWSTLAGP
jgi:parallel beta-helix repeat protein